MAPRLGIVGRYALNSAFGSEEDRRSVAPHDQNRINRGVAAGSIRHVEIQGSAGQLSGYFHPPTPTAKATGKTVLFLSGSGAPVEELALDIARVYQQNGFGVLTMNYRGFGASEGEPTEQGFHEDAMAMLEHLTVGTFDNPPIAGDADIVLHGYSMGAPIAARLATELHLQGRDIGSLFLDRPMPSMSKAVRARSAPVLGRIAGKIAKESLGTMSVEKNLQGLRPGTRIFMSTDNEDMGRHGEALRRRLRDQGFDVQGNAVDAAHDESDVVMRSQFAAFHQTIADTLRRVSRRSGRSGEDVQHSGSGHHEGSGSSDSGHRRSRLSSRLPPSSLLLVETPDETNLRMPDGLPDTAPTVTADGLLAVPSDDRAHELRRLARPVPPAASDAPPAVDPSASQEPSTAFPQGESDEEFQRYLNRLADEFL